ncbi:DUF2835 domain-containing protein [Pseudocolwellia sp. AS88]|jgi:hypothetical protein|uniref:DUF2835 domain-containing protein n=1 Tax=Pseudocolwellia TaxID=2848177 RepID=UPI0026EB8403|nr:DUF2835 domain-containing protein [Pseudocolwellia sp. AS88]MDO7083433.1 DUF2835 domain-containing protein [Pseudocolwellia sp. AS88]
MKYYFHINISYDEFLPYYQGKVTTIVVMSTEGQRIQFPAMHIRKYLLSTGIKGLFCMHTKNNKFLLLEKIR